MSYYVEKGSSCKSAPEVEMQDLGGWQQKSLGSNCEWFFVCLLLFSPDNIGKR